MAKKKAAVDPQPVLRSIKEWKELGKKPKDGEEPRSTKKFYRSHAIAHLFDDTQVQPIRKVTKTAAKGLPITVENILKATWTVNRTAKRYRDAAASCYGGGYFGFAASHRERKEAMYRLKDRGIAWLVSKKIIAPDSIHGGLCLWRGGGYSFHSSICPNEAPAQAADVGSFFNDAKPKGADEMKLIDAVDLLERCPDVQLSSVIHLETPKMKKTARARSPRPQFDGDIDEGDDEV